MCAKSLACHGSVPHWRSALLRGAANTVRLAVSRGSTACLAWVPNYWTPYALSSSSLDPPYLASHFSPFKFNELHTASVAITQEKLRKALLEQKNSGMRLGYTLVKLGFIEETEVSKMLARQYRMPAVDL